MALIRIKHLDFEEKFSALEGGDTNDINEWKDTSRLKENGWESRYKYEADVIFDVISQREKKVKTILEVGSGPGELSQKIQEKVQYDVDYHLVDKPFAKKFFDENNYKGKFFVKDISLDLDMKGLLEKYDVIICNDTLEHLLAPTNVIKRFHELSSESTMLFISVPNWRMAHQFIYRGLWDYDNFLYLMYCHGFDVINVYSSILQTPYYPKLDSEEEMPDELLQSWNWYFIMERRKN